MKISEVKADDKIYEELIRLSEKWEAENSCYGYRANKKEDIEGNRIFLAAQDGKIIGYLFGHKTRKESMRSAVPLDKDCFEVMEIFVEKEYRNKVAGKALFKYMEEQVEEEYIVACTATKNYKAILHFYIDEVGMIFHSASLYKKK